MIPLLNIVLYINKNSCPETLTEVIFRYHSTEMPAIAINPASVIIHLIQDILHFFLCLM
jgi:hypothetical protein